MESTARTVAKALTWQVSGLLAMTAISFAFTGALGTSGKIALISMLCGFVAYCLHERAWARIAWGRPIRSSDGS
ncbi:MAG: DUF2061 domain-containing protein [Pseudomonadota bacterium]